MRRSCAQLLADHDDVLLIEDDHCAGIAGVPLHTLAGTTRHWAFVRSAAKAYGPDLRLALLAGDQRTVERVHGRLRLGPGWISHLLQDLAVSLWRDKAATRLVHEAEAAYTRNRTAAARGAGRSRCDVARPIRPQRLDSGARRNRGDHPATERGLGRGAGNTVQDRHAAGNTDHRLQSRCRRNRRAGRRGRRGGLTQSDAPACELRRAGSRLQIRDGMADQYDVIACLTVFAASPPRAEPAKFLRLGIGA